MLQGNHTERLKGFTVEYWRGNSAAGSEDKWDRAVVCGSRFGASITCKDLVELNNLRRLLGDVHSNGFAEGREDVQRDIRKALGL